MKMLKATTALTICLAVLAGCGGGGTQEAGSPTPFSTVPDEITVNGPDANTCAGPLNAGRVYIYGGTPPYRIDNTQPQLLRVSPPVVDTRLGGNAYFEVFYLTSACLTNIQLAVVDARDQQVTVSINSDKGE